MKNWVAEGIASDVNDFTPQWPHCSTIAFHVWNQKISVSNLWNMWSSDTVLSTIRPGHVLRTSRGSFFFKHLELLGLGRNILRPDYQHPFWFCEFFVHVFNYSTKLFLQKTKPLYPTFKWSGIGVWATKNLRFSFCVSLVRVLDHYNHLLHSKIVHALAIKVEKSNKSCK